MQLVARNCFPSIPCSIVNEPAGFPACRAAARIAFTRTFFLLVPAHGWQRVRLLFFTLVGLERLELSTSRLSGVRSNHLSYRPVSAWSFLFRRRQAHRCLGHVCLNTLPASTARLPCRNKKSRRGRPLSATKCSSPASAERVQPSPFAPSLHQKLVELVGIEPTTSGLQSRCSPG